MESLPPCHAAANQSEKAPDHQLRAVLFWALLCAAAAIPALSHYCQWLASYALNDQDSSTGEVTVGTLQHGSYGFYLGEFPARRPNHSLVVLFGNSVYQNWGIAERMQARADREERSVDFVNCAMTGSGIHDHLVELAKVVRHKPDLVVISFINLAFTADYGRLDALPRFRTDADQMAFDPDVIQVMPGSFYRREYNLDSACHALVSSLVPLKRMDPILRAELRRQLEDDLGLPSWFFKALSVPTLNLTRDWLDQPRPDAGGCPEASRPYPETAELLGEIIAVARSHNVGLLFLRQESGPPFTQPDILPELRRACATYDKAHVVDLIHHYDAANMPDGVHPYRGADQYADRHYQAVMDALESLRHSERG